MTAPWRMTVARTFRFARRLSADAASNARKAAVHLAHPTVRLDAQTHLEPGVTVRSSDDGAVDVTGSHLSRGVVLRTTAGGRIRITNCFVGYNAIIAAKDRVEIGDGCQIAEMVVIRDQDHRVEGSEAALAEAGFVADPVRIGREVWIGAKATILKGVTIGDNAVIAAGAVVRCDVPARTVWGGVPARQLRVLEPSDPAGPD